MFINRRYSNPNDKTNNPPAHYHTATNYPSTLTSPTHDIGNGNVMRPSTSKNKESTSGGGANGQQQANTNIINRSL